MGVGLFAKCSVNAFQAIFSERPLLIVPRGFSYSSLPDLSVEETIQRRSSKFEEVLQQALGFMTKEDVDAYMNLSNCLPQNCPQLYGIARTNGFDIDIEGENLDEGEIGYVVVGKLASRINHRYVFLVFEVLAN